MPNCCVCKNEITASVPSGSVHKNYITTSIPNSCVHKICIKLAHPLSNGGVCQLKIFLVYTTNAPHCKLAQPGQRNFIFACYTCGFIDFFFIKIDMSTGYKSILLTQSQNNKPFRINLMDYTIFSARNQCLKLAEFSYGKYRK